MIASFFVTKNWHHEGGGDRYSIDDEEARPQVGKGLPTGSRDIGMS